MFWMSEYLALNDWNNIEVSYNPQKLKYRNDPKFSDR